MRCLLVACGYVCLLFYVLAQKMGCARDDQGENYTMTFDTYLLLLLLLLLRPDITVMVDWA